ncbi:MAG: BON domain-containing protein [Rhodospirillales bacterium]
MKFTMIRVLIVLPLLALLPACAPVVLVGAAAGGGALVAEDRRSPGIQLEDQNIELKAGNRITDKHHDLVHINVTSFNRNVLLTGEAPTSAIKADVEKIAAGVENVHGVVNEIAVAGVSSMGTRANDAFITSKVKAAYLSSQKFYPNHVKVVTESNVVYLLGMVTRKEADDATDITRNVGGVQKVVRVFEYVVKVDTPAPAPATAPAKEKSGD